MKVLWIMYSPIGRAAELIENRKSQSGTWIDATAKTICKEKDIELGIASIASRTIKIYDNQEQITYYGLEGVRQLTGESPKKEDVKKWREIIDDFAPNIVMVWGTENANGISILQAVEKNVPVLFFIQGIMGRNTRYPLGLLRLKELSSNLSFISLLKFLYILKNENKQRKQVAFETQMVRNCDGVIVDSEWAASYYRNTWRHINLYYLPLPINECFFKGKHSVDDARTHTIFTVDGRYPGKGIFQLIKSLRDVVEIYPDCKLIIPGSMPERKPKWIFESPYFTYLKRLIKKYNLENNVCFCGRLSVEEMKAQLLSCHIFVMPSCFENHSASLREALYMGVPSVTSLVGCIDEYTHCGEDVLSYRYGENDVLAEHIIRLFNDKEFAKQLGQNAYENIRHYYPMDNLGSKLYSIYKLAIERKKNAN